MLGLFGSCRWSSSVQSGMSVRGPRRRVCPTPLTVHVNAFWNTSPVVTEVACGTRTVYSPVRYTGGVPITRDHQIHQYTPFGRSGPNWPNCTFWPAPAGLSRLFCRFGHFCTFWPDSNQCPIGVHRGVPRGVQRCQNGQKYVKHR